MQIVSKSADTSVLLKTRQLFKKKINGLKLKSQILSLLTSTVFISDLTSSTICKPSALKFKLAYIFLALFSKKQVIGSHWLVYCEIDFFSMK